MLRHARRACALAVVCLPASLAAQSKFEGVISVRLAGAQGAAEGTYSVKGDQVRMDLQNNGLMIAYTLMGGAGSPVSVVMPGQRVYMEMPQAAITGGARGKAVEQQVADVKMTGKMETIAGYQCEHMLVTSDKGSAFDLCVTKELGAFAMMGSPMQRAAPSPWQKAVGGNFFPLRVQQVGGDVALEVTKIEKKRLDPALFTIPEGFQKIDMGKMGRSPR